MAKGRPRRLPALPHEVALCWLRQATDDGAQRHARSRCLRGPAGGETSPKSRHRSPFRFVGLVALPIPCAPTCDAIAECRSANVRVIMITGDYRATAHAIAERAGLEADRDGGCRTRRSTRPELRQRLQSTNVCARIMPEQKLRIVEALKANGEMSP